MKRAKGKAAGIKSTELSEADSCTGKVRHNSIDAAKEVLRITGRRGQIIYHCRYCAGYHTGHPVKRVPPPGHWQDRQREAYLQGQMDRLQAIHEAYLAEHPDPLVVILCDVSCCSAEG